MEIAINRRFTGTLVWLICAVFFTYEFLLRTMLGTFEVPIRADFSLDLMTFALLSSTAYQAIYGIMQIPVGMLIDRFGLKPSLLFATFVCSAAVMAFAYTHAIGNAFAFRFLMGLGSAFGFIGVLVAVYEWMPRQKFAFYVGLSQFIGTLGPMFAAGPLNAVATESQLDWRIVFNFLGVVGLGLTVLVFFFVKNNKDYSGSFQILKRRKALSVNLYQLMRQPQAWLIALYSATVYFTIEYLSENSGKVYLMLNGYDSNVASNLISIAWIGYAIGCPLLGLISDKIGRRKLLMMVAAFVNIFAVVVIIYFPINYYVLMLAFIMLGIGASGQSVGFAIMAEQCNNHYLAAGLGFNNAMITVFSASNAPLIGWLLGLFSHGKSADISAYQSAFFVIFVLLVISLIAIAFIKETFCKSTKVTTKLSVL